MWKIYFSALLIQICILVLTASFISNSWDIQSIISTIIFFFMLPMGITQFATSVKDYKVAKEDKKES